MADEAQQQKLLEQGRAAYGASNFARALDAWVHFLENDPANFEVLTNLLHTYHQMGDTMGPLPYYERALKTTPDDRRITITYLDALVANQEHQKAFELAKEALKSFPDDVSLLTQVARVWMGSGESEKARKQLWHAHEIDAADINPLYYLARIGDKRDFERLDAIFADAWARRNSFDPQELLMLSYARGAIAEKQGRVDEAWEAYVSANETQSSMVRFDEAGFIDVVKQHMALFGALTAPPPDDNAPGHNIIFIVSLPRSGSTLTEQILASHSRVKSIGERMLAHEAFGAWNPSRTPAALEEARSKFLLGARAFADCTEDEDPVIVDKSINNYIYLGFLRLLFPGAKFVHVVRAPLDTAISCYATPFGLNALKWCSDLETIGRVFRRYQKLMKLWMRQDRGDLMTLSYEELTADPETKVRELIAFCGLDWEPECLAFHQGKRQVSTASASQVRQPIYKTGQGRAAPFEKYLSPLKKTLGRAASPDWYRKGWDSAPGWLT